METHDAGVRRAVGEQPKLGDGEVAGFLRGNSPTQVEPPPHHPGVGAGNIDQRPVESRRGVGEHGHLGLVMPNVKYQAQFNATWDLSAHPGAQPILPANPTAHQINKANQQHCALIDKHRVAE